MESAKKTESAVAAAVSNSNDRLKNYFRSALSKTTDRFLSSLSFKLFRKYFANIHAEEPTHLLDLHERLISQLKTCILQDLKDITKEMKIPSSLCALDAVIGKHENMLKEQSWRPTGDPETDLRDHIYKMKLLQKEKMLTLLKNLETERKQIQELVNENHVEIMNTKNEIDDKNTKLQNHLSVMNRSASQDLEVISRSVYSTNSIGSH